MLGITLQETLSFPSYSRELSQAMGIPQSATNRAAQDSPTIIQVGRDSGGHLIQLLH